MDFTTDLAEIIDEVRRLGRMSLVAWDDERIWCRRLTPFDHANCFQAEVLHERVAIVRDVLQRNEHARLLIVDVAADAPLHSIHRRIGAKPLLRRRAPLQVDDLTIGPA